MKVFLIAVSYHSKVAWGDRVGYPVGTQPLWYQIVGKVILAKSQ